MQSECDYWKPIPDGAIALPCNCGEKCDERFEAELGRDLARLEVLSEFPHKALGPARMHRLADEIVRLRAENAALRAVLTHIRDDAESTITQYNTLGPTWTSRESGMEYYDASYVIGQAEERMARIDAVRAAGSA